MTITFHAISFLALLFSDRVPIEIKESDEPLAIEESTNDENKVTWKKKYMPSVAATAGGLVGAAIAGSLMTVFVNQSYHYGRIYNSKNYSDTTEHSDEAVELRRNAEYNYLLFLFVGTFVTGPLTSAISLLGVILYDLVGNNSLWNATGLIPGVIASIVMGPALLVTVMTSGSPYIQYPEFYIVPFATAAVSLIIIVTGSILYNIIEETE